MQRRLEPIGQLATKHAALDLLPWSNERAKFRSGVRGATNAGWLLSPRGKDETMVRQLGLAAAMFLVIAGTQANAGVQDGIFEGSVFLIPDFSNPEGIEFQSLEISADFGPDFSLFREELDGEVTLGSYEESGSTPFISSWTVNYAVTNSQLSASGTCFFSFITTYRISDGTEDKDYFGILVRTGDSELIDARPPEVAD
jgi:hypothetical protein